MGKNNEMTFWDHLDDLRKSLIHIAVALVAAAVVLFCFKDFLFEDVILAPSKGDFILYRLLGTDLSLSLVNIDVAAQFLIHMKVTLICALILIFPYIVFKVWEFIAPALYDNEKKAVKGAFAFASILFYLGLATGYFLIFPLMLNFFSGYQVSPDVVNTFSLTSYISFLTSLVMTFGIVFEFPTIVAVLSSMGILAKEQLKGLRKYAFCIVLVLAALITPSGDPFSMLVTAFPLYVLYEFSILICRKGSVIQNVEE
ncbi:MAG: twin-arginine translocase subunit TatC [Bacteroidales bacterium]|nr:twin-arginine translocase subunit TatC [Bacteroidales bacterium]